MNTNVSKSISMIKEKGFRYGIETLSDDELIAIFISDYTDEDPVIMARRILVENYGVDNLARMTIDDFASYIGEKALLVSGAIELSKRIKKYKYLNDEPFNNAEDIFNYVKSKMPYENQEVFKVLALNTKNFLIGEKDIFIGSQNQTIISVREVLSYVLNKRACRVVAIHNHPSGHCNPSNNDIVTTKQLQEGCKAVDIELLDHIIIGNDKFYTMKGQGFI